MIVVADCQAHPIGLLSVTWLLIDIQRILIFIPGHTLSWGMGVDGLLSICELSGPTRYGPINPARESTYNFLGLLFAEIMAAFPDKTLHIGGDEVPLQCW